VRRINEEDKEAMRLLNEGAKAAQESGSANKRLDQLVDQLEKQFARQNDQIRMLQYSLGNLFKTLQSYPAVKAQLDGLDYRTLGTIRALNKLHPDFDNAVEEEARLVREETFQELSDEDDKNRKLVDDKDGAVELDSTVIITSSCAQDPDKAIFRSKIDVGGPEIGEDKDKFLGKKVGETFDVVIQGLTHSITLLALRKPDASQKT